MIMTKGDIIAEYNQAKNHRQQITILADQNLISEQEVVDILTAGGCDVPMGYKYRKTRGAPAKKTAPTKKPAPKKSEIETATETIPRSLATRMIVETAALDTIRQFLANKEVTWEDFLVFTSGVVDLTTAVGKRCG